MDDKEELHTNRLYDVLVCFADGLNTTTHKTTIGVFPRRRLPAANIGGCFWQTSLVLKIEMYVHVIDLTVLFVDGRRCAPCGPSRG